MIAESGDSDQSVGSRSGPAWTDALDCHHPEAVDLWSARLGNRMAAQ
jgi:hypothetical protein